jgi:hypothetical protein
MGSFACYRGHHFIKHIESEELLEDAIFCVSHHPPSPSTFTKAWMGFSVHFYMFFCWNNLAILCPTVHNSLGVFGAGGTFKTHKNEDKYVRGVIGNRFVPTDVVSK